MAVRAAAGGPLVVTELAPLPEDDPRGVGLAASLFPILLGGMASGVAAALALRGPWQRLAAVGGGQPSHWQITSTMPRRSSGGHVEIIARASHSQSTSMMPT